MKHSLLLLVLLISISANAQDIYPIRKMQAGLPNGNEWVWGKEFKVNFTITVADSIIIINDTPAIKLHFVEHLEKRIDSTSKDDKTEKHLFGALDHNKRKCIYIIAIHEKSENNSLELYYRDICFRYFLKQ